MSDRAPDIPSPLGPHMSTPREVKARLETERTGRPHLIYREGEGRQVIRMLEDDGEALTIGRHGPVAIALDWDLHVSRRHAKLESVAGEWMVVDNGSSNGSFLNRQRVYGPHPLRDGDELIVGQTMIVFRSPGPTRGFTTTPAGRTALSRQVSDTDRRVLVALCRPYKDAVNAVPASNKQIAEELHLSVPAVKKRLSAMFMHFELDDLPQSVKRSRLAVTALQTGLVTQRDL